MSRRRKSPWFIGALTLCGVIALGELFFIYERWSAARGAEAKLAQRQTDLGTMASMMPPPTREVATAIEEDLARAQAALTSMRAQLKGRGPAAERLRSTRVPAARTDAYFDLASYVERMRELARKNEVAVRPEALRFGFAAYANEGPEAERIEPVFRQRLLAQYLVESLMEARPRAILAVQREPTLTAPEREARAAALAAAAASAASAEPGTEVASPELPEGPDYFAIDQRLTARKPGFVDTTPFRFVFTGQTASLRAFLNRLAAFELPVLVREVKVDIASTEDAAEVPVAEEPDVAATAAGGVTPSSSVLTLDLPAKPAATKATAKAPVRVPTRRAGTDPIVAKTLSKFTVTVEFIELVSQPAPPADGAAAPTS